VHHDERSSVGLELSERTIEAVAIRNAGCQVAARDEVDLRNLDFDGAASTATRQPKARVDSQPIEPRLESIRIPEVRKLPPSTDQSFLDGVARELRVPKDEARRRAKPEDGGAGEDREGVMVATLRSFNQAPLVHRFLGWERFGLRRRV
jgi:hypothetical protein